MTVEQSVIDELLARASESLNVEVKAWIDPATPEGQAKIVRAALALRNRDGGFLLIGFDDKTMKSVPVPGGLDVRAAFHVDRIQQLVSHYASEPFEISVGFGQRDGQLHPVIAIPSGVRTPVAATRDLKPSKDKRLVREGAVYFRSLRANDRVSSAEARPGDWREISEITFNNREADIGAFFRRHLASSPDALRRLLGDQATPPATPTRCELATAWLTECLGRFHAAVERRRTGDPSFDSSFLELGTVDVALVITGPRPPTPVEGEDFLRLIQQSNPSYTAWPAWLDSSRSDDVQNRPRFRNGAWESLIISAGVATPHIEFSVFEPQGRFFLHRVLQDDLAEARKVPPRTVLDPWLQIYRITEIIAVGRAFARAMGFDPAASVLTFRFRWSGLADRTLSGWANTQRAFFSGISTARTAADDVAESCVEIPLDTAPSAIPSHVGEAMRPLLLAFDGLIMPQHEIDAVATELLKRRS